MRYFLQTQSFYMHLRNASSRKQEPNAVRLAPQRFAAELSASG